jgi:cytochrome P450/catechol 2,3-dioxygenase-like lactoylglutathione lyase family enzyme
MAIQRLAHVGIWVDDLPRMSKFYSEVLGLQITDATGEDVTPGAVFLSSRPDKAHHELALMAGRTNHDPGRLINQISWMCESLDDLQGFRERLAASEATFHEIVTHGIAVGIYFYDPEGNRSEVFAATGIDDVPQPYKKAVDLNQPLESLLHDLDRQHQADGIPSTLAIHPHWPEEADMTSTLTPPTTDIDLFSADVVADPFPVLARIRDEGPVVYCAAHDFYVLTRYADVRAASANWRSLTSAKGVALTEQFNEQLVGSVLASDPPEHDALREVLSEKLAPRGLAKTYEQISGYARRLVAEIVARGTFDGVADIARVYPVNVVGDLVGLPVEGRETLQPGADATFAGFGPFNEYVMEHLPQLIAYTEWMGTMADRSKLTAGGWGEAIMDAVDAGRLTQLGAIKTISAYMTAGMDTTVNAISALMRLFADRPDVWAALKADPRLAGQIFEEILRLETPVTGFFRVATQDLTVGESVIPEGAKVLLHWAAANRDPAKYADPDTFDLNRNPRDHIAFGYGPHACAGQGLARMEAAALLEALAAQVGAFELTAEPVRGRNPVVRGYESVPLRVVPGSAA